ncbi:MAG TPA: LytTR family DNA-binding domain-containing protein [Chitinophagaceae bacterium]
MPDPENQKSSCLIVDDEPMARDVLRRYVERIPTLGLVGECSNAIDALLFLQNNKVDLVFLDIRMPELLGTEFVQSLRNPPKIIFTTAFKEYALDGFELDAVDYLLKPVRFERFLKAVNKAFPKKDIAELVHETHDRKTGSGFIYLRVDRKLVKIVLADILYIESARDYVKVFTKDKTFLTRQTISSIEAMLSVNEFIRIHRSYIIAVNKIKSLTNELVEIGDTELPIGKLYKHNFFKLKGG